jgi:Na+/H+-dicarboxylate symporter
LFVGFALQSLGEKGAPILRGVAYLQRLVFKILAMIMWAAPIGAFGAIAAVVGSTGADALKSLAMIMVAFYITCFLFVIIVLGTLVRLVTGLSLFSLAALPRPGVPAHPVHIVVRDGAAAADREDGAPRREQAGRRNHGPDRLLVQP